MRFGPAHKLGGALWAPADKSISHRAALLSAMSSGSVCVSNYLHAADTLSTLAAIRSLGAAYDFCGDELIIHGVGLRGARQPQGVIDVGNAGTLLRLLPGWLCGQQGRSFTLDGDASIRGRPLARIIAPLSEMGADLRAQGDLAPLEIRGAPMTAISYQTAVASAQVKSCLLLAALLADGETVITESSRSRDHTERMLLAAGVEIRRQGQQLTLGGVDELLLDSVTIPGDPSSSAFMIAAATLVPNSRLIVKHVGVGYARSGFCRVLRRMGGEVVGDLEPESELRADEPVSDLEVSHSALRGVVVSADEVPLVIDELPLVALLGCFAEGDTIVEGARELRVKESDRIAGVVDGLRGLGATIEASEDGFAVHGADGLRGGVIDARGDHRLAMMGAIAGLASREGVEVVGMDAAVVSYPGFVDDLSTLI